MKTTIINLLFILILLIFGPHIHSCTGFMILDNKNIYFCNGEDWDDNDSFIAFYPPKSGEFGRIMFEYSWPFPNNPHYITDFGGINDHGLVFDEFAHKYTPLTTTHDKPVIRGEITQYCMKKCATIEEVLAIYGKYNLTVMNNYQTMFGDKNGKSVIIEGDDIIPQTGEYKICTNFLQSKYKGQKYPCNRYNFVESKLTSGQFITIDYMKAILEGVHNPGPQYPTQYSQRGPYGRNQINNK